MKATDARYRFTAIMHLQLCAKAGMGKLTTACCLLSGFAFFCFCFFGFFLCLKIVFVLFLKQFRCLACWDYRHTLLYLDKYSVFV